MRIGWLALTAVAGAAIMLVTPGALGMSNAAPTTIQTTAAGPTVKLIAAQSSITIPKYGTPMPLDPGIWIASLGSSFEFRVLRANYSDPISITQVTHGNDGSSGTRRIPSSVLDGWNGFRNFIRMTVKSESGKDVASSLLTFCPNSSNPERVTADSPESSPYPEECAAEAPFQLAMIWAINKNWAVDPTEFNSPEFNLEVGTYKVTETIMPAYVRLFDIPAGDSTVTVTVSIENGQGNSRAIHRTGTSEAAPHRTGTSEAAPSSQPTAISMSNPPVDALPDLVALPSWGISTSHTSGADLLNFGATVWVGGNGPLDVEGFRVDGSPIMKAYQYFWENGRVIGRAFVGTMGFDSAQGHNHWHFEQFAQYSLLNSDKKLSVRSQKVGFCIAPTDPINLLLPRAEWQPPLVGLVGQCGVPTTLWVQEMLPVGWGDTYVQSLAGQSFDITDIPNGTYYIEVIANPLHVLHETTTSNDISLRQVILGGKRGHRSVKIPAWNGIDPEK